VPKCESANLVEVAEGVRLPPGAKSKLVCGDCGRWIKWVGASASEFRMPFGQYEGRSLAEINEVKRSHLERIANKPDYRFPKIQAKVREFLESNPAPLAAPPPEWGWEHPKNPYQRRQQEGGER
jgi:hypothetical protein